MPLPERWSGTFYDKDTCGDLLFDLGPAEFAGVAESSGDVPAFLFAGAAYDLALNGHPDRSEAFLRHAKAAWPDAPWPLLDQLIARALAAPAETVREDAFRSAVSDIVSGAFSGVIITVL